MYKSFERVNQDDLAGPQIFVIDVETKREIVQVLDYPTDNISSDNESSLVRITRARVI
jgi:hypothetical protein